VEDRSKYKYKQCHIHIYMNMYPIVGVFEASREGGKGEENDRE
jgi:hypothetical protein